jgi:hypothetical protein
MKLIITIDTEEDDAWSGRGPITTENVRFLPRFQSLCEQHGFRPSWLATEPVLADPRFVEALGAAVATGRAEIGAHLHPWACAPYADGRGPAPSVQSYPHEIPVTEFRAKMERITGLIRACFGVTAGSYRAGRWGFAAPQVPVLLELGIRVDCSVTPHLEWRRYPGMPGGAGGPDFRGAPRLPYLVDASDVRRPGDTELLELPMTVLCPRGPFAGKPAMWDRIDALAGTMTGRVLRRLHWTPRLFRPWPGTRLGDLLNMRDTACELGLPYLMLMFHSSELMPGGSPYFPDEPAVERLYALLAALFPALTRDGITGSTLVEFAETWRGARRPPPCSSG